MQTDWSAGKRRLLKTRLDSVCWMTVGLLLRQGTISRGIKPHVFYTLYSQNLHVAEADLRPGMICSSDIKSTASTGSYGTSLG